LTETPEAEPGDQLSVDVRVYLAINEAPTWLIEYPIKAYFQRRRSPAPGY
jgi:hypothetical protein